MKFIIYGLIILFFVLSTLYIKKKITGNINYYKEGILLLFLSIGLSVIIGYFVIPTKMFFENIKLDILSFLLVDILYLWITCSSFKKNEILIFLKIFFVFIIAELFVFNFRFYQSRNYQEESHLKISSVQPELQINNKDFKGEKTVTSTKKKYILTYYVEIKNLKKKVNNIYIDSYIKTEPFRRLDVQIYAKDEANCKYYKLPYRSFSPKVEESKYMHLYLSGKAKSLKLKFEISGKKITGNEVLHVSNIAINKKMPLKLYLIRPLLFTIFCFSIYLIRPKSKWWKVKLNFKSEIQKAILLVIISGEIIFLCCTAFSNGFWLQPGTRDTAYEYNRLAVALKKGHFYLDKKPPKVLEKMKNPYDLLERRTKIKDISDNYLWDHVYYKGNYYVYFGIVPCVLFYLPLSYILGDFVFLNFSFIYICGIFLCIIVAMLLKEIVSRFFPKIPTLLYILLYLLCINGCGLPYIMHRPDFYFVAIISALTLSVLGLYLWISSTRKSKLSKTRILIGSICMALVAGCRPQFVLGSFFAIPIFYSSYREKKILSKKGLKETILFILPYIVIAMLLMYYNYARFGSIFDFGANYNLTTNDMTKRGFQLARLPLGIYTYLFQPLDIVPTFPFIQPSIVMTNYLGRTVSEPFLGGAIVTNILLVLSLFVWKFKKYFTDKRLYTTAVMSTIFALIIICVDTQMAGILPRYLIDFNWLLVISTVLILLSLYTNLNNKTIICFLKYFVVMGVVLLLTYSFLLVFVDVSSSLRDGSPRLFYKFLSMIMFWM